MGTLDYIKWFCVVWKAPGPCQFVSLIRKSIKQRTGHCFHCYATKMVIVELRKSRLNIH